MIWQSTKTNNNYVQVLTRIILYMQMSRDNNKFRDALTSKNDAQNLPKALSFILFSGEFGSVLYIYLSSSITKISGDLTIQQKQTSRY